MPESKVCEYCLKVIDNKEEVVDVLAKCGQGNWDVYFHFKCFMKFLQVLYKSKQAAMEALD